MPPFKCNIILQEVEIYKLNTMEQKLTKKREAFAISIATGEFDYIWQAYEAHYATNGMSQNAIYVESCRLLQNPKISLRINELLEENKVKREASLNEVLAEMANWLRLDPIDMFNDDDTLKNMHELPESVRKTIASFEVVELFDRQDKVKVKTGELKRIKLVDKKSAADMYLKRLGAYINNVNISTEEDLSHIREVLGEIED